MSPFVIKIIRRTLQKCFGYSPPEARSPLATKNFKLAQSGLKNQSIGVLLADEIYLVPTKNVSENRNTTFI